MTKPKDALDTLGTILTQDEGRDAVHVAVICCRLVGPKAVAGNRVSLTKWQPSEGPPHVRVSFTDNEPYPVLGIIDPFLTDYVQPDTLAWVFLMPRTITSLSHRWTHPAFPEEKK